MTAMPVQSRSIQLKHVAFVVLALLGLLVLYQRELQLLHADSFLRKRYVGIGWLIVPHGIFGALALFIAPFQFSSRLRQRTYACIGSWAVSMSSALPLPLPSRFSSP
jgi:hypothetical protein